jgi:hypothetical protein
LDGGDLVVAFFIKNQKRKGEKTYEKGTVDFPPQFHQRAEDRSGPHLCGSVRGNAPHR